MCAGPGREGDQLPASSDEVTNECSYTCPYLYAFMVWTETTLLFYVDL